MELECKANLQDCSIIDNTLMCKWELQSKNACQVGCRLEISLSGMLKAIYSPQTNRICYLEMIYDVMSYMQQLRRAAGRKEFIIVPNTLSLALSSSSSALSSEPSIISSPTEQQQSQVAIAAVEARMVFTAQSPYVLYSMNEHCMHTFGYHTNGTTNSSGVMIKMIMDLFPSQTQQQSSCVKELLMYLKVSYNNHIIY